jgi:2',3'-cyclic-nucleotide 2'-phosphodiesterase (5'-nucleotidase family)
MSLRLLHYADIENAYDDPERIGRLVGCIDRLRDEETVVCGAGDNTAPGVLSLVTQGRQALDFFRTVEPDVDTFGNHDFDHGFDALRKIVADSPQIWVSANVRDDGTPFAASEGTVPRTIIERGGHRVGVVGVTAPETPAINPPTEPLAFTDPVATVREHATALRNDGADCVVVLSHCGNDEALAHETDADVVLGGHDHDELIERIDGTLLTRPGNGGRTLLEVDFDGEKPTATHHEVTDVPPDESVATTLHGRMDETGLTEVVTTLDEPVVLTERACMQAESPVGNLVVDAHRWRADADVALATAGIRETDPLAGAVTAADLIGLVPYGNDLAVLELTGERLREALRELSVSYRYPNAPEWWFGHVSGARVVWDDRDESLIEATVGGEPLADDATYTVATSAYFVYGDNLFSAFGPEDRIGTAGTEHGALVEYAREQGIDTELDGRIERPHFEQPTVR